MGIEQRIGRRVMDARRAARLTQGQLAERVGVAEHTIGRLERGEQEPPLARLEVIAETLGTTLAELVRTPAKSGRRERAIERLSAAVGPASVEDLELVADLAETIRRRASGAR